VSITINVTNIFIPNGRVIRMGSGREHPVADGLIRLSGMTQAVFVRTAERHGLPAAQARLLCMLATGPRRMSELAGLLGIEKAALTGLADRAERGRFPSRSRRRGARWRARFTATSPPRSTGSPTCCHRGNASGSAAAWPGSLWLEGWFDGWLAGWLERHPGRDARVLRPGRPWRAVVA
jgi:hypothetical protein